MIRVSLSQVMMCGALLTILGLFAFSGRAGQQCSMLECVSFSSDGSQICVSRLDGRDANTPGKLYTADVSRVVSLLSVADGEIKRVVHRDFRSGNCGPAFKLWRVGRTSAEFNPDTEGVVVHAFGGGDLTRYAATDSSQPVTIRLSNRARNIVVSRTGRFIAASGDYFVSIVDGRTNQVIKRIETEDLPFLHASLLAFSHDETRLVVAGLAGIHVWDIQGEAQPSTVVQGPEPWINAIAVAPDDTVLVCTDDGAHVYDFHGTLASTLVDQSACYAGRVSPDGRAAALVQDRRVLVVDLATGSVSHKLTLGWAPALAFSPDSQKLAVGLRHGRVSMIHLSTGAKFWTATPPGRYRWPWTLPAFLMLVWAFVAWILHRRSPADDGNLPRNQSSAI